MCELCKRSASTIYCPVDAASLCSGEALQPRNCSCGDTVLLLLALLASWCCCVRSTAACSDFCIPGDSLAGCDRAVHESNPLPHAVVPIEQALVSLATCEGRLVSFLSTFHKCYYLALHSFAQENKSAAPAAAQAPHSAPAEDEVSACGEHAIPQVSSPSEPLLSSELNTSVAIVPEMHNEAVLGGSVVGKDAPWSKELEVSCGQLLTSALSRCAQPTATVVTTCVISFPRAAGKHDDSSYQATCP